MPQQRWLNCILTMAWLVHFSGAGYDLQNRGLAAPTRGAGMDQALETSQARLLRPAGGTLAGAIVDEAGQPVSGAAIRLTGSSGVSGADGTCRLPVPAGIYSVGVHASRYRAQSGVDVLIPLVGAAHLSFSHTPTAAAVITGQVTDGSSHAGMPLYARIDVTGSRAGRILATRSPISLRSPPTRICRCS